MFSRKNLLPTLRFVSMVAIPLCVVNSLIFSLDTDAFFAIWLKRFCVNLILTFPQAVLYVSLVNKYDNRKKS